ncbi:unnamed protein product, partial [Adineta steineri]
SLKTLTTLNLSSNHIGDVGAERLADALRQNTTLITLGIERNRIEDAGAQHLAHGLQYNTVIRILDSSTSCF